MSTSATPGFNKVALIAGPTASGKSDLAVRLALALAEAGREGVVINADSAQVYADLAVLSARPSDEEMRGVPHKLFATWDGATPCSAADWAEQAKVEIAAAHAAGAVPILVGGTGLYIRTLLDGISPVPPIDPEVRAEVRAMETADIYAALLADDEPYGLRLNPADRQRTARGLEVIRSTGKSLKAWQAETVGGIGHAITLAPMVLLPERQALYDRCDRRFAQMLDHGAVEEVERLLARDLPLAHPVMTAIGVKEVAAWLRAEWTKEEALAAGQQATRNYVKRQYTWLRNQCPPDWPRMELENVIPQRDFEILFRY